MASAQIVNCIVCKEPVRPRQQAIQCDGCFHWNHRTCNTGKLYIYMLLLFLIFEVDTYFFIGHLDLRVCSSLIGISQSVYRAAVHDGGDIDWHCPICSDVDAASFQNSTLNPGAESTRIEERESDEPSLLEPNPANVDAASFQNSTLDPGAESTRIEEPEPESDEPSLMEPNPAEHSSTFAVTYEIVEQCLKRGRPKLIDRQGFTYNMQRQRGRRGDRLAVYRASQDEPMPSHRETARPWRL